MNDSHQAINYVSQSFFKSLSGSLTDVEFARLEDILTHDEAARKHYYDLTYVSTALKNTEGILSLENLLGSDADLWAVMAEYEKAAPGIEIPKEEPRYELIQKVVYPPREKRKMSKFNLFTLITSAAAVLFLALFIKLSPDNSYSIEVATLVDQMNVKWTESDTNPETGSRILTNRGLVGLEQGIVSIQFDDGVDVLIEGPAVFEVGRSEIYLEYGRLYGRVAETGLGFTVKTPTTQIVDHGTEFGVKSDIDGSSELHVIKGKVQLFAGKNGGSKMGQMVTESQAVRFDNSRGQINTIPAENNTFVRKIDSRSKTIWKGQSMNLADVVGDGSGFGTGNQQKWIDVSRVEFAVPPGKSKNTDWKGTSEYRSFGEHPYIDGVFIPNGQSGPQQVSSVGHSFEDCQVTNGQYWIGITNSFWRAQKDGGGFKNDLQLDNVKYNSISNPSICMHSNLGITFDLEAIRDQIQSSQISRFTAKAGLSQSLLNYPGWLSGGTGNIIYPKANFYVLVDGEIQFEGLERDPRGPGLDIDIKLTEKNRFLTLIVTQGPDESDDDWALFAKPFLHFD